MEFSKSIQQALKRLQGYLKPDTAESTATTVLEANALLERSQLSALLTYRDVDEETNLVFMDDGEKPAVGFMLRYMPLLVAGTDVEPQLEAVINACPPDSIIQFGVLSSPQIGTFVDAWEKARTEKTDNPLLQQIATRRTEFYKAAAENISLLPKAELHPRNIQYFVSARIPYTGDVTDGGELEAFIKSVVDIRDTMQGALEGAMMNSRVLTAAEMKVVLRELVNPQFPPAERLDNNSPDIPMHLDIVERESRVRVLPTGALGFSRENDDETEVVVSCLTVDSMPSELYLPMAANLLGNPEKRDERISVPFWAYTNIHVLEPDRAHERLTMKLGNLNKQCMSESPWYQSMMGHLFKRRDSLTNLIEMTNSGGGHQLVRVYAGVNLVSTPMFAKRDAAYVSNLWRGAGFRTSPEKFISLPVYLASLPLQYTPSMDPPGKGLQRAVTVHSFNAACLPIAQGDWTGNNPLDGGPLMVSRRGQVATFNLLESATNYNFVIVAASGSGKSFFANEICADFLSRNGIVRIIDAGKSYARFCQIMGGVNMVFDPKTPLSMNPFTGINQPHDLHELLPMMKTMLRQMAWPLSPDEDIPGWEYSHIETALVAAWEEHRGETELRDVYNWLKAYPDPRSHDLADQLAAYAIGRYSPWFNGPRQIAFDNDLIVIEMNELNADPELQAVVLTLCIHHITKEMYLSDRARPKLLGIDEAWRLMGNLKTGMFIEEAFRTARKFNGIAGVITQGFMDFEKSQAARASLDNAAWQFILHQRPESLEFAMTNKKIIGNEAMLDLLRSIQSGNGYSEVFVRSETGEGVYRFVTDRHSYFTYTSNPKDINRLSPLENSGVELVDAIDQLAREDYQRDWDGWQPEVLEAA